MIRIVLPATVGYVLYHCLHTQQGRTMVTKMAKTIMKEMGVAEKTIANVSKVASEAFKKEESDHEKENG